MPLLQVGVVKDVFGKKQKQQIIGKLTRKRVAKTGLYLIAGCSLALLVSAGCGTALAHGGGGHSGGGNHFSKGVHAGNFSGGLAGGMHYNGHNIDGAHWHHHHHHRGNGPGGLGKVHGPGSSHNPIVYHPVHGPGSSHNPIIAPTTVVRDHRGRSHSPVIPPGSVINDHRPRPHRPYGCRNGYWRNCAWGSVHDHRS